MLKVDYYDTDYDYLSAFALNTIDEKYPLLTFENYKYNMPERHIYDMSNEDLISYMHLLDMRDKKVATAGSSGDQLLNAIYYGAKDITLIDGNPYARAYIEYKIAMIKNMDLDEFSSYFDYDETFMFNYKTYRKISHDLSKPVQIFWDKLILEQGTDFNIRVATDFQIHATLINQTARFHNSVFYVNNHLYKMLQDKLINGDYNINYITCDYNDFSKLLDGKYDVIMLSNIFDYCDDNNFANTLKRLYKNNLNAGGKIQYHYDFHMKSGDKLLDYFNKKKYRKLIEKIPHTHNYKMYAWILNKPEAQVDDLEEDNVK